MVTTQGEPAQTGAAGEQTAQPVPAPQRAGAAQAPLAAAALIVAHNQARRIAATVRSALSIPGVDLVLVVDDASTDNSGELARKAGAVVVRHSHRRGRTPSLEIGASVIAMRDIEPSPPRALLLLDANLGSAALGAAPLVATVLEGVADLAIGLADDSARETGSAAASARRAVAAVSGWSPLQPLSRVRCVTREGFEEALPLARGAGLETGMTLDIINAGLSVTEVPCELRHKADRPAAGLVARANQYRDVMMALSTRRVKGSLRSTQIAVEDAFHVASAHPERKRSGESETASGSDA